MAEKKKQHFVPQMHLRMFADGERINCYDIKEGRGLGFIPYSSQCQKGYLYGKSLVMEDALGAIESSAAEIIRSICNTMILPERNSSEHHALLAFLIFQNCRTIYAKEAQQHLLNHVFETYVKPEIISKGISEADLRGATMQFVNPFNNLLKIGSYSLPLLFDLEPVLVVNNSAEPFITSDNPCYVTNPLTGNQAGTTGWACTGIQFTMPLSPQHLILLVDRNVYEMPSGHINIADSGIAEAINCLTASHANQLLYYSREAAEQIESKINVFLSYGPLPPLKNEYHHEIEKNKVLQHVLKQNPPIPKNYRILSARDPLPAYSRNRDPEIVLLHHKFVEEIEAGRKKASQWNQFLEEEFENNSGEVGGA